MTSGTWNLDLEFGRDTRAQRNVGLGIWDGQEGTERSGIGNLGWTGGHSEVWDWEFWDGQGGTERSGAGNLGWTGRHRGNWEFGMGIFLWGQSQDRTRGSAVPCLWGQSRSCPQLPGVGMASTWSWGGPSRALGVQSPQLPQRPHPGHSHVQLVAKGVAGASGQCWGPAGPGAHWPSPALLTAPPGQLFLPLG